jgi:hypothetical protein
MPFTTIHGGDMGRFILGFVGFLIVYGSVGAIDYDPNADVVLQSILACLGLLMMYVSIKGLKE